MSGLQALAQALQAAPDPTLDGAQRAAGQTRNILVRVAAHEGKLEAIALLFVEQAQAAFQQAARPAPRSSTPPSSSAGSARSGRSARARGLSARGAAGRWPDSAQWTSSMPWVGRGRRWNCPARCQMLTNTSCSASSASAAPENPDQGGKQHGEASSYRRSRALESAAAQRSSSDWSCSSRGFPVSIASFYG